MQRSKDEFWQLSPEEKRMTEGENLGDPAELEK